MKKILLLLFLSLFFNPLWAKEIRLFNRLELVLPQAEQGDKEAQFNVGVIYMLGWNTEIDHQQAVYWFEKAAAQNHRSSLHNLGVHYSEGMGVETDFRKAASYFERAAQMGHTNSMVGLAHLYQFGNGVEKDLNKMLYWLEKAGEQENVYAQQDLAEYFLTSEINPTKAVYWLEKLVKQNPDEKNELVLANQYLQINQIDKAKSIVEKYLESDNPESQKAMGSYFIWLGEYDRAAKMYEKSAAQGDPSAQHLLGKMYFDGLGVKQDYTKSFDLFLQSANQGFIEAQLDLARSYLLGKGTKRDNQQAIKWLTEVAETGHPDAQFMLGTAKLEGRGTTKNIKQGIQLLTASAQQGNKDGQYNLAQHYKKQKNIDKAIYWFEQATLQGDQLAFSNLTALYPQTQRINKLQELVAKAPSSIEFSFALMLKAKKFGSQNQQKWKTHLISAAERGNSEAQSELGMAYFNGTDFEIDFAKARYWLEQADNNNIKNNPYTLGLLYLFGLGGNPDLERAVYFLQKSENIDEGKAGIYLAYLAGMGVKVAEKYQHFDFEPWAQKGDAFAQVLLADQLHQAGQYKQALIWAEKSAQQGNAMAQAAMGAYYIDGNVVERDLNLAVKWLNLAVAQNNPQAQHLLGNLYLEGKGVPQDKPKAYQLFELAALQGDEESILRVAEKYRQEGNREKMLEWLNPILAENRKARYMLIYDHLKHEEWLKAIDWLKKLTPAEQDLMIRIYRGSIYEPYNEE